jgi:heme-degrading monooxygenase HmoA
MFARITRLKVKPGQLTGLIAYRNSREPELKKMKGLRHIIGLASKDGEYVVIALYESEAHAEDETTLKSVGEFWFRMSTFIEGQPDVCKYDVTHFQKYSST